MRTFSDGGLLKHNSRILIVISKYDLIAKMDEGSFSDFANSILARVVKKIPALEERCRLYQIAAMPGDTETCLVGYGVEQLLDDILAESSVWSKATQRQVSEMKSQFNLWGELAKR